MEILQFVRSEGMETKVLVMTAAPNKIYLETANRRGADSVLSKPFHGAELCSMVAELLSP